MSLYPEHYEEDLFEQAEASADVYLANKPFDFKTEIIGKVDPDARAIINGMTIREATKLRCSTLHRLERDPRYHGIAREYWGKYCYAVAEIVNRNTGRHIRLNDFPLLDFATV